jgi:hypothetical protein
MNTMSKNLFRYTVMATLAGVTSASASELAKGITDREYNEAGISINDTLHALAHNLEEENGQWTTALHQRFTDWQPGERPQPEADPHGLRLGEWRAGGVTLKTPEATATWFRQWRAEYSRVNSWVFKLYEIRAIGRDRVVEADFRFEVHGRMHSGERVNERGMFRGRFAKAGGRYLIVSAKLCDARLTAGPGTVFRENAKKAGIDYFGHADERLLPPNDLKFQTSRHAIGGVSAGDINGDGWDDLVFCGGGEVELYLNQRDGSFRKATREWGLADLRHATATLLADFDNDGDADLYVGVFFGRNRLYRNEGDALVEVTNDSGLSGDDMTSCLCAFDANGDGLLDLYVGRFLDSRQDVPRMIHYTRNGEPNRLYLGQGDLTFRDVSAVSGADDRGLTLGIAAGDYDKDGDQDLYLANDFGRNVLLRNRGNGTFEDVAKTTGTLAISAGMSAAMGDYDNDGRLDLYVSSIRSNQRWFSQDFNVRGYVMNLVQSGRRAGLQGTFLDLRQHLGDDWARVGQHELAGNYLLRNLGNGEFADHSEASGTRLNGWYWGSGFLDLDNDGWLDIYAVNGWISGKRSHDLCLDFARIGLDSKKSQIENRIYTDDFVGDNSWNGREHNHFFRNLGNGRFMEMGVALGLDGTADARGFAASDFDHDGDIDLVVNNYNAPAYYYVNHWNQEGNWLAVSLRGTKTNRDGVGSEITVHIDNRPQHRLVSAGHAYTGQFSLEQIFGMGQTVTAEVQVRWPDGSVEDFGPHKADQRIVLTEGEGRSITPPPPRFDASANTQPGGQHLWTRLLPLVALAGLTLIFTLWKKTKPKRKSKI